VRQKLADDIDPLLARRAEHTAKRAAAAKAQRELLGSSVTE
jgi:hypothetical protein